MFQVTTPGPGEGAAKAGGKGAEKAAGVDFSLDFFDRPAYLTVSGQLEAETFASRWARPTPSARPSAPRTATRPATWPSSG